MFFGGTVLRSGVGLSPYLIVAIAILNSQVMIHRSGLLKAMVFSKWM